MTALIKRPWVGWLGLALACHPLHNLHAAEVPDAGAQQGLERQQRERQRQEERLERAPSTPPVAVPADPRARPAATERNIPVKRIETGASEILSAQELRAAVAPFEGRLLSLADLVDATEAINALYAAKGAPTARAVLRPQDVEQGVVRITLIEARLGRVRLGPTRLGERYVLPRLGLAPGERVSVPRIESALQRFNRVNDVQLAATLAAGSDPGTTDVALQAADPPRAQWTLFTDNAGSDSLGEERLGLALRMPVLSERGDSLTASLLATGRAPSLSGNLGYTLPLEPMRRLELSYSQGRIAVRRGAFAALDVTGRSREGAVALGQALVIAPEGSWNASLRLAAKDSTTWIAGTTQRQQRLTVLALGSSLDWQDDRGGWTADATLAGGLRALGGEAGFSVLRLNAARLQRLASGDQWLLRAALQASPDADLPSSEQFQLGGSASVRGYSEGLLSGRQGGLASIEFRHPLDVSCEVRCGLAVSAFADAGAAWSGRRHGQDALASAGLGLSAERGAFGVHANLAWPLRDIAAEANPKRPRLHLAATVGW